MLRKREGRIALKVVENLGEGSAGAFSGFGNLVVEFRGICGEGKLGKGVVGRRGRVGVEE